MRRHGWELPYHPLQVVAIAVFLALAFAFYVFFVTFVGKKDFEYIIIGLFSFLVASVFSLYIWCAASDPADPAVLTSKKYSRTSEFGRSLSFKDSLPGPGSVNGANTESVGEKTYSDGSFVTVIPIKESINQAEKLSCSRILLSACLILCAWFPLAHKLKSLCASKASSEQHTCEDDMLYCSLCEVEEWMVSLGIAPKKPSMESSNIDNKQAFNDGLASKRQREVGTKSIEASEEAKKVAAAALAAVKDATAVNKGGKIEVDAGADLIITQLFYDTDIYLKFVNDCRQIGIKCPIVPGIMPINNYKGFLRMAGFCKTKIPSEITAALEPIKDNDEAVRAYGIHLGTEMCKKILAHGIKTLHLYTLNMEKSALGILANLGLIDMSKIRRPLPWRPATNVLRTKENVRPIFWANRPRSYISRTIGWEQFPHGRWGDTRSPAYGALNDYQFLRRRSRSKKIVEEWVVPLSSIEDIQEKFANFCSGKLKSNPWSELDGLQPETVKINEKLEQLNWKGFLTINSQPAVNGEKSDSPSIGWGGAAGYVYQKAYVEFFCSPEKLNALVERAKDLPFVTYIAVNKKGATVANIGPADVNAVTWGVFPAKEVVQPTVVDPVSFMVWKDEAFQAWEQEWASLYPDGDPSRKILEEVQSSYYLVSVVDNDYIHGDLFSVFEEL